MIENKENNDLCKCGVESVIGAHGIKDGEVYDQYLCEKCYLNRLKTS